MRTRQHIAPENRGRDREREEVTCGGQRQTQDLCVQLFVADETEQRPTVNTPVKYMRLISLSECTKRLRTQINTSMYLLLLLYYHHHHHHHNYALVHSDSFAEILVVFGAVRCGAIWQVRSPEWRTDLNANTLACDPFRQSSFSCLHAECMRTFIHIFEEYIIWKYFSIWTNNTIHHRGLARDR